MGNEKWQIEEKNTEEQKNRKSEIPTWMILTTSRSYIFPNIYIDCFYVSIINLKKNWSLRFLLYQTKTPQMWLYLADSVYF